MSEFSVLPDKGTVSPTSRRGFLKKSTAIVVGSGLASNLATPPGAYAAGDEFIRIGLVGCGGRGTGAARQALAADPYVRLVAMADVFEDQLQRSVKSLKAQGELGKRVSVEPDKQFVGFDAYKQLIHSDVDVVLLATPPHFRPIHLRECIDAGKHVFAEKPVAVDGPGIRSVLETTELAKQKNLSIVSGLNTRYSFKMQEMVRRVQEGAIGDIKAMQSVRYASGVWVRPRKPETTDMQYQMRNWYYFTWLSGDFNVEQFVHQMDLMAWMRGDKYPISVYSTGGRQARTGKEYGHIFDHFSSVFEYDDGVRLFSTTRHQRNCSNISEAIVMGTTGQATVARRQPGISGENPWEPSKERETDSHQLEHDAFFAALRNGRIINNGNYMAKSSMMAIIARMSAYTGQKLTWEQAMNSKLDLSPSGYNWDATPPESEVAVPGVTRFV